MLPLVIRGQLWGVVRVSPGNPFLIDRTGVPKLATTDPHTKMIRISTDVPAGMFDQVYLHEITHAIMEESGVTDLLSVVPDDRKRIFAEEFLAWFLETHAAEAIDAASRSLGRKVCILGTCVGREEGDAFRKQKDWGRHTIL